MREWKRDFLRTIQDSLLYRDLWLSRRPHRTAVRERAAREREREGEMDITKAKMNKLLLLHSCHELLSCRHVVFFQGEAKLFDTQRRKLPMGWALRAAFPAHTPAALGKGTRS
jgi:hypothetical protein